MAKLTTAKRKRPAEIGLRHSEQAGVPGRYPQPRAKRQGARI